MEIRRNETQSGGTVRKGLLSISLGAGMVVLVFVISRLPGISSSIPDTTQGFQLGIGLFATIGTAILIDSLRRGIRQRSTSTDQINHNQPGTSSEQDPNEEDETKLALQVQESLLSHGIPELNGFIFDATIQPARHVMGSFYDFFQREDSCYLTLANISEKGIPAAMLASTARAFVRAAMDREQEPSSILQCTERMLFSDLSRAEMFATMLNVRLDVSTGSMTYASAGHTEVIWWSARDNTCHTLPSTGVPFGILKENQIKQKSVSLRPGDMVVFYSNGITRTANKNKEVLGTERLIRMIKDHADCSAQELSSAILTEVRSFSGAPTLAGDITIVALKVVPHKVKIDTTASSENLGRLLSMIRINAEGYGADFAQAVEQAAAEVTAIIQQHAYEDGNGELFGAISLLEDRLELNFLDYGQPFDASKERPGLQTARRSVNELIHKPRDFKGNHWHISKRV